MKTQSTFNKLENTKKEDSFSLSFLKAEDKDYMEMEADKIQEIL